jgi:hypothetical protein
MGRGAGVMTPGSSPTTRVETQQQMNRNIDGIDSRMSHPVHDRAPDLSELNRGNGSIFQRTLEWFSSGDDGQSRHLQAAIHKIKYLEQQLGFLQRENARLNEDLLDLQSRNHQFEADLREVQVKSFKEMVKESWTPMEDRVIQEKLGEIHKEIEDWVADNCVEEFEEVRVEELTDNEQHDLLNFLRSFTIIETENGSLSEQLNWWVTRSMDPVLIPTAVITHFMYISVFNNPFLALGGAGGLGGPEQAEHISNVMLSIYQVLLGRKSRSLS